MVVFFYLTMDIIDGFRRESPGYLAFILLREVTFVKRLEYLVTVQIDGLQVVVELEGVA